MGWDLRAGIGEYLGNYDFNSKSVLEVGPASGFVTISIERLGATAVTCIEPDLDRFWDIVPQPSIDTRTVAEGFKSHIQRVRNAFWYVHRAFGSRARVFVGDPYAVPADFGPFDVAIFASVLLHVRSPLAMVQDIARRVKHAIIITDLYSDNLGDEPVCRLLPDVRNKAFETWWNFHAGILAAGAGARRVR
jgi:O-methyltransferase